MSHRILLVDDEIDILEFVRYNLVREGYEVFTAQNGAEALEKAAECRPHLILLDMMMPVMDGAQTCRAIRENPVLKDTMVVFLSALGEEQQQLAGFGVGADDYHTKPLKQKLLERLVQAIDSQIWGQGFDAPVFANEFRVVRQSLVKDAHTKLILELGGQRFDAIFFRHTETLPGMVRLAYRPNINEFMGRRSVQLVIEAAEL